MIGKLDPEEHVMEDPEYFAWKEGGIMDTVQATIKTLGWESTDEIDIEIGGTQVSGIDVGEDYNKKWQSPKGTRKYNKDAFIIIKNLDRNPTISSQPFPEGEFKPQHGINTTK